MKRALYWRDLTCAGTERCRKVGANSANPSCWRPAFPEYLLPEMSGMVPSSVWLQRLGKAQLQCSLRISTLLDSEGGF